MTKTYDFELLEERDVPEINGKGRLFRHKGTGARFLSIENDDENKSFGIFFRTPVPDSTGVPHILEHSVLAGSEKYPVKNPFRELMKGSLQTFINAFTFPDKTGYPCASQNTQDLYNLVDVYMDAVLHPLISPHTLDQEGWHFDLQEPDDPLTFKGVVFNEMKGNYSDPEYLLYIMGQSALFPGHMYAQDAGGTPEVIPDLTYEQCKGFHEAYYHPSNSWTIWYGDDDPEERLHRMSAYFKGFTRLEKDTSVPIQKKVAKPQRVSRPYAVDKDEKDAKYFITFNWLLPDHAEPEDTFNMVMLEHLLIGTQASPLRKALIDSGLGEDLVGYGLAPYGWHSTRQMFLTTGLQGVAKENVKKVEVLVKETLSGLVKDGIDPDMIAATLNTVEFQLRENNTGLYPRGIMLMLRALSTWLYDGDPFGPLAYEAPLEAIKEKLAKDERYFEKLIREYFVDNPHHAVVVIEPDTELFKRETEEETARLADIKAKMTPEEIQAVIDNTKALKEAQEAPDSPEALASLPLLTLDDLDKKNKLIPIEVSEKKGVQIITHDIFTNSIAYVDVGFDLHSLPQDLIPYIGIFLEGMVKLGTQTEDLVKLSQRIGRETGGIAPTLLLQAIRNSRESAAWGMLRAKATVDKVGEMFNILKDILLTTNFDNQERFIQILLERKAQMEMNLVPNGHVVVNRRLTAAHTEAGWLTEQTGGVDNIFFTRGLIEQVEKDWPGVVEKFDTIRELFVNRNTMLCNVTLDGENWKKIESKLYAFLEKIPAADVERKHWKPDLLTQSEGLSVPAQVNYVGKGANLFELGYELDGSIEVARKYLGTTYIYEKLRVQGGAYGAFMVFYPNSGTLNYVSYRDPNLTVTVDNYDGTPDFLRNLDLDQGELIKSIIGTIGDMDTYQLPDAKGFTSLIRYLIGYTDEKRQKIREEVLDANAGDFKALADVLEKVAEKGIVIALGSAEAIEAANKERGGFLEVKKVM